MVHPVALFLDSQFLGFSGHFLVVYLCPAPQVLGVSPDGAGNNALMVLDNGRTLSVFVGDAVDPELHAGAFEESAADATKLALRPYAPEDPGCFASRLNLIMDAIRRDRPTFAPVQVCGAVICSAPCI